MFRIFSCGDILITQSKETIICPSLSGKIKECRIVTGNLEAPLVSAGKPIPKAGPHLHQCEEAVQMVKKAGFTHLSLANNHIFDYGEAGLRKTLDYAEKHNIRTFGAGLTREKAYQYHLTEADDTKIAFLAFCEAEFGCLTAENKADTGYAYINHKDVNTIVAQAKANADVVIVSVHAGVEKIDIPLPEWRERYREICIAGADAVIGHHPHVPQGWEMLQGKPVFYSLGNFHLDWKPANPNQGFGYSVVLTISNKRIENFDILPHHFVDGQTKLLDTKNAHQKLAGLCEKLSGNYAERIEEIALKLYYERYARYYAQAVFGISSDMTFLKRLKQAVKQVFMPHFQQNRRQLLLWHNIRIDSHRYITQRALQQICEIISEGKHSTKP